MNYLASLKTSRNITSWHTHQHDMERGVPFHGCRDSKDFMAMKNQVQVAHKQRLSIKYKERGCSSQNWCYRAADKPITHWTHALHTTSGQEKAQHTHCDNGKQEALLP